MVMNMAHQPTEREPDTYNGNTTPEPTSFAGFSGILAVPVHNQATITAIAHRPLIPAATYIWKTGNTKAPPVNKAAHNVRKVGPGTRRHCSGSASETDVTRVSRLPSAASAR